MRQAVGAVVIGRNEGKRLEVCLVSLKGNEVHVVYVDSGSTDGSVELAKRMGAEVVALDMAAPFTAARARNAGFARLRECWQECEFVQFVDGDCEVVSGWFDEALSFLLQHEQVAVVCGRRRERHPEASVYNLLCDLEWDTPVGEAKACGGDALMRVRAVVAVGGYRADLIAGEEPELCIRLRSAGWRVWRVAAEMTLHDAAIYKLSQWWRRTMRGGYAFAEGASLHGAPPECHWVRESRRALVWGAVLPCVVMVLLCLLGPWALFLLLLYPAQVIRLSLRGHLPFRVRLVQAFFLVLGKFPEMQGQAKYWLSRVRHKRVALIEYK